MALIIETLKREKNRIEYMLDEYNKRLEMLPKGSISEKHAGSRTYYYLKYRDGKRVVSQYIPPDEKNEMALKIEERQHVEAMVKSLKKELKLADRALGKIV